MADSRHLQAQPATLSWQNYDQDGNAAYLLGGPGDSIPEDEAERLGLKKAKPAENKQAPPPENKAVKAAPTKTRARKRK